MSNIALMKQKLTRLKGKLTTLEIEVKGIARDITPLINPSLHEPAQMEIAKAATKMDDLVLKQAECVNIQTKIWELEEELGD